jgi:hypothetical protein
VLEAEIGASLLEVKGLRRDARNERDAPNSVIVVPVRRSVGSTPNPLL